MPDVDTAGQLLLFGGTSGMALGDTWTWDGRNWTQRFPSSSPGPRYAAAASYSPGDRELVLFGGYGGISGTRLGNSWVWNARHGAMCIH